jgi:HK97 family phage prohead protease
VVELERRALAGETRLEETDRAPVVRGYAAVFDQETELWPGYREVIRPGAFKATLEDQAPKLALWNHETSEPLASTRGRPPLRLFEDHHGLGFEFTIPPTQRGREIVGHMQGGVIDSMSFGFRTLKADERARNTAQGVILVREIQEVKLFEVSLVSFPAYAGTEAQLRAARDRRVQRDEARRRVAFQIRERLLERRR